MPLGSKNGRKCFLVLFKGGVIYCLQNDVVFRRSFSSESHFYKDLGTFLTFPAEDNDFRLIFLHLKHKKTEKSAKIFLLS